MNRVVRNVLAAALLCAAGCDKPALAPGLDQYTCDGGLCAGPGVVQGKLVYSGTARGDGILLLFDTAALPPPDGTGTGAAAVARVPEAMLFKNAPAGGAGPFSAAFTFTQVPSGRSYQVRAFLDASHQFDPFFDYAQQPRAGDPVGGYGEPGPGGQPRLLAIPVAEGQVVTGINVPLTQTLTYDPPSFELAGGSQTLDQNMDQPVRLKLRTTRLPAPHASFDHAHFALELDRDTQGNRRSSFGDGLDDVFPRVFLRQLSGVDGQGNAVALAAGAAVIPCRIVSTKVLPALVSFAPGAPPLAQDTLDVLVQPVAAGSGDLKPLAKVPAGKYQVIVVQRSGQVWRLPNQLGDPASAGTPYFAASQAQSITIAPQAALPSNSVSGSVVWRGDPSVKSGNIVVQAYRDDPYNPPPPIGAALPVRVQIIPASAAVADARGFTAPYRIEGLPQGSYLIQALDDVDGNFSSLSFLRTPTSGDLTGAVLDPGTGRPASVAVSGNVTSRDVTLLTRVPADPPAFEIDPATPAAMPADQVAPVRFNLRARPLSFPAGRATAPQFAVQLIRDSGGATVDADHDGLPDVWPRVFLVRLDSSDPAGLTQYLSPDLRTPRTQVIPAAVDPTPFLPALQPQPGSGVAPVLTDKLTIVVRPALLDASTPDAPPQRLPSVQPGAYKVALLSQTSQAWQIPNEAGSAALDPGVVCDATAVSCAPGTVQTQSQSRAFQVGLPGHPVYTGRIVGSLAVGGTPLPSWTVSVFAYGTNALPPFGQPVSADFHTGAEIQAGSVSYLLPNLPPGDYVVTAVVDTRGDFATSPAVFAMAPGAGNLVAGPAAVPPVGTSSVTANLTAGAVLPQRPSFELVDGAGTALIADASISFGGAPSASMRLKPVAVLGTGVVALHPDSTSEFRFTCRSGKPVGSSLSVELLKVADVAGLVPELDAMGRATVIPAAPDPTPLAAMNCTTNEDHVVTGPLDVLVSNASAKVNLLNRSEPTTALALVPGRYAVVVTSLARQVWRVPNELQLGLLDAAALLATPAATKSLLQTQQVAVNVSP
jgi:uncharacterized protein (DUF2141 family)